MAYAHHPNSQQSFTLLPKLATITTSPYIPRFYNKRLRALLPFLLLSLCLYKSITIFITTNINQAQLEESALELHKESNFNPKNIALDLYNYVIEREHSLDSKIGDSNGIYFHWDDWVDLSVANHLLNPVRMAFPSGDCDPSLVEYGSVSAHQLEAFHTKVQRGAANLYCSHPIPRRVVITTDESFIEVPVIGKKRFGNHKMKPVKSDLLVNKMKQLPSQKPVVNLQKRVEIDPTDFIFKPDVVIFGLQEKLNNRTITQEDLEYLEFLEYSNNHLVDYTGRYFKYPWIYTDIIEGKSHHIAYPFFKRYISDRERQSVLHHIIRAWFQFAEVNGFASWINHGSLLGWAFNGLNMPWDTDIDVQMPIAQLDRLGREFNRTLVVENPRYGNGRYWLEVAPTYIRQGNGKNFIDARFIDIQSGLYIDISALSHTEVPPPTSDKDDLSTMLVHCKNWNWESLAELLPIRHTYFEGASVYIPHKVKEPMKHEYGANAMRNHHFNNHNYQPDLSLWVSDQVCANPPPAETRFNDFHQLTKEGACDSKVLLDEYNIAKECIQRHHELNQDSDMPKSYDITDMGDLPIFRKDAWDYYYDINHNLVEHDNWYVPLISTLVRQLMPKVYITGAFGFIAQHIVKLLLQSQYDVVGTVRSKEKGEKLAKSINNTKFQYVVVANIAAPNAFDESLKQHSDVSYILHTASPFTYTTTNPEQDLIVPAIEGTRNILNAADQYAPQLVRFVLTSSDAAIYSNVDERNNKLVFDEQSWNNIKYEDATVDAVTAYYGAKSFAEKLAWEFMEMNKPTFALAVVNPSYVFGPQAYHCDPNHLNESNAMIGDLLKGNGSFDNEVGGFIDVRDVAKAHVFAMSNDQAVDCRLFMNNGQFSTQMILDIINEKWPELNLPKGNPGSGPDDIKVLGRVNNSATKKLLPWEFLDLRTTVVDTVEQILSSK
ncbi:hypothetical protein KGF57_002848 [Candida theae]|uniref:NAD-dependent epimerase/dehydratase domain-containing protein n=1 Tax=Candida theae TaxID=1198502 RepID=A0AAD5BEA7_9ASCO|nr:uncharacterized protein KGF57_002848 [Candida theae]KAI5958040.1 hypothetical protein KGF57_002848 [Candida theae]